LLRQLKMMIDPNDLREMATAILSLLVPDESAGEVGLTNAIRTELLVTALQDSARPRTLHDLWRVLRRLAVGRVAEDLVAAVAQHADEHPDRLLTDIAH
jgi:hypothetical protein